MTPFSITTLVVLLATISLVMSGQQQPKQIISSSFIRTFPLSDFVPLYDSLVVVANTTFNSIDLLDVDLNLTISQVPVKCPPKKIVADPETGLVYVSCSTTSLARVNMIGGSVSYISLPASSVDLDISYSNLYVLLQGAIVLIFDKHTISLVSKTPVDMFANTLVVARNDEFFITGELGISGGIGGATRYEYASVDQWNKTEVGIENQNANTLVLSPDLRHVELVCGGGNGEGYSINDYDALNFTVINGNFATDAYPVGGAYTPDQNYFLTSNYNDILVFDTMTYSLIGSSAVSKIDPYFQLKQIQTSTDGLRGYAYASTGFGATAGVIIFFDIPQ